MKKFELFLNIIHYQWFRFEVRSGKIFDYPALLLIKFKPIRKRFIRKYMDKNFSTPEEYFKSFQRDPEKSFNSILAGAVMNGLLTIMFVGLIIIASGLLREYLPHWMFWVGAAPALLISYIFLFKGDKYLHYFKEFDKKPKSWQRKWSWITFFTIIGVISYFIGCFAFMIYRI